MSLLELKNINVLYGKGKEAKTHAISELSLRIEKGDFITIRGKSGCGKTTLLNVIGGLIKLEEGEYYFQDVLKPIHAMTYSELTKFRKENIGYIVQQFALLEDMSVVKNIELPMNYCKISNAEKRNRVENIINKLDLVGYENRRVYELSGGQKQKVAIARALVTNPKLIIADEPTGALDENSGRAIMDILKEINQQGTTIIMVTHDIEWASFGKCQIYMKDGKIVEEKRDAQTSH